MLTTIKVLPLHWEALDLFEEPPFVACTPFFGGTFGKYGGSDELYVGGMQAEWTHLQIRKRDLLKERPRPTPQMRPQMLCRDWLCEQMRASKDRKPKSKDEYRSKALERFPGLSQRQFASVWSEAVRETGAANWSDPGPLPGKSNRRAR